MGKNFKTSLTQAADECNVYKVDDSIEGRFFRIPKVLIEDERYKTLSSDSKLLYGLLLDRLELSKNNGWVNDKNEVYLLYSRDEMMKILHLSRPTITKAFQQLSNSGLIREIRQGQNKPNMIYVGKITDKVRKEKTFTSGRKKSLYPEGKNFSPNDTDISDTYKNTLSPKPTIEYFIKKFKEKHGLDPVINWAKDSKLLKTLLNGRTQEELETLIDKFFASEDKFIKESSYSIGVFYSQVNKLLISSNDGRKETSRKATQASIEKWR